ncbi:transcription termination factor Rho [Amycolatopsis rhizosphaerae]|uniref:Transcription termination factor Rho n=1 Tax=Amycolatopsis rhizosphaerae TaxID=2053003 RepID=A0A558BWJ7_9PSEU|nr:transcription termination factor Rho [Amycolatopsis rhizosphaerae]TVT40872.1 transcription termination factor Rho [Amycolatopsis rhizosphaerae]
MSNTDLLSGDLAAQATPVASGSVDQSNGNTPKRRSGGLSGMVIADLRELAAELGVGDTKGMRKGDLIAAIRERQGKSPRKRAAAATGETLPFDGIAAAEKPAASVTVPAEKQEKPMDKADRAAAKTAERPSAEKAPQSEKAGEDSQQGEDGTRREGGSRRRRGSSRAGGSPDAGGQQRERGGDQQRDGGSRDGGSRDGGSREGGPRDGEQRRQNAQAQNQGGQQRERGGSNAGGNAEDEDGGRRGRRFRDRRRRGGGRGEGGGGTETEIREDDVLLPVAGILDVLDNYAFVRTSGYLPGPNDVYVSLSLVRKYGLRRGDAITGVVKQPREGEQQRQKFNPLVRVDSVNGLDPEQAKRRPEFTKLTPLYPNERLRLETESHRLTTRVIDLVMPVGKGQRALIVSPPKAGKTTIMQDIANAITTNNPECHLMVVLVDERPEEVTDMQRSVKGEVIASTFDRPPSDHTSVAELSIERAKRLVEMGMDVVVLLDSITRLGRAYNLAAPASGRILSGGVDSTALFPPKRFLGAARNIENGGSLTIFATAMVETGSTGDTVIFEEFKGTGNAELKLDRKIAERRVFPAVDINPSGTRKEELLLSPDELAVHHKLHRVLHALDSQQAIDLLLSRLRKTKTNIEFLMQVSKTALGSDDD